jgi:hypothetical protein
MILLFWKQIYEKKLKFKRAAATNMKHVASTRDKIGETKTWEPGVQTEPRGNRGREADRRRNKHLKMNLFPSARSLAQKKLN